MSNSIQRRSFLKLCGGGSLASLAGHTSGSRRDDNSQEFERSSQNVQQGGTLNLISPTVSSLDPIQATDSVSHDKINNVYENLTHYPSGTRPVEYQLVESVDLSADLLTYTFHIKQGVTYHNNPLKNEVTAHDFKYSFRRLAESSASRRQNFILNERFLGIEHDEDGSDVVPDSLAIEVIDKYTFKITLVSPNPRALDILAFPSFSVMPEGLVGDIQGYSGEYTQQEIATSVMVGTGPFEFEMWDSGSEIKMTAFDNYHGKGPYLDALHSAIIESASAIWTYAMEENADIFAIPQGPYDPDLVSSTTDNRGREVGQYGPVDNGALLHYTGVTTFSTFYAGFNAKLVPRPVRRAVAHALDYAALFDDIFPERSSLPAFTFTPPSMWPTGYDNYGDYLSDDPYGRNESQITKAETLLSSAGYTSGNPFDLTFTRYASYTFESFGRHLSDILDGLAINFTQEEESFADLVQRGESGDLQFFGLGWVWGYVDPAYGLQGLEPKNTNTDKMPSGANGYYLDWNAEQSSNVTKAQNAWNEIKNNPAPQDQSLRNQAMVEMEEARRGDMILLPLFHGHQETVRYRRVRGPRPGALGRRWQQYNTVWISPTGTAAGSVNDADGNPLTGADIEFVDTGTGETEITVSPDGNGEYTIDLPVATYDATADKDGYDPKTTTVTVTDGGTQTVDFTLTESVSSVSDYANDNGIVVTVGLLNAIDDWRAGEIEKQLLFDVVDAWQSDDPV